MSEMMNRLPYHEVYVEVVSGDWPLFVEKSPSVSEVYNDEKHKVKTLFSCLREDLQAFLQNYRDEGTFGWFEEAGERFKKRDLSKFTGFKPVSKTLKKDFEGYALELGMIERMRCLQYENRSYGDLFERFDSKRALFYVDYTGVSEGKQELADQLMGLEGKGIVFGLDDELDKDIQGVLIDEGWKRFEEDGKRYWVNYSA